MHQFTCCYTPESQVISRYGTTNQFSMLFVEEGMGETKTLHTQTWKNSKNQAFRKFQLYRSKQNQINYLASNYVSLDHVDLGPFQVSDMQRNRSVIKFTMVVGSIAKQNFKQLP